MVGETHRRRRPGLVINIECQDPAAFRVLVAKGVYAPVAAYGEVCRDFLRVNRPGVTAADLSRLPYHRSAPHR